MRYLSIKFLFNVILFVIFFPLIILIIILKKFILIRFGEIETRAVGHYGLPIEIYLSELEEGYHKTKIPTYDIWIRNKSVANKLILEKWRIYLNIYPPIFKVIWIFFRNFEFGKEFLIPYRHWRDYSEKWPNVGHQMRDIHNVLSKTKCHFSFTDEEKLYAEDFLKKNNINKKIIVFFARDSKYRESKILSNINEAEIRNCSIETYKQTIFNMVNKYNCVRMGSDPENELKIEHKNFFDYSFSNFKSELNDLFILSKCHFIVSSGSGFDQLGIMFRRPVVLVNAVENEYRYNPLYNSPIKLFIPKKIFSKDKNRLLTFKEIFDIGAHNLNATSKYIKQGLKVIDNTPNEINDVVEEMEKRVSRNWVETQSEIDLQNRYWEINKLPNMPTFDCKIGAKFLKNNIDLLT